MLYVLVTIVIFGVLIAAHEFGHFLSAKAFGVRVDEFSVGMGPAIVQRQKGETLYSLRAIPLGGFCALEGEDGNCDTAGSFHNAGLLPKLCIMAAGSVFNFLIGLLILLVVFSTAAGFTVPVVTGFEAGSSIAQDTGLQVGDRILRIDDSPVLVQSDIALLAGRDDDGIVTLTVRRDGKRLVLPDAKMQMSAFQSNGQTVMRYGLQTGVVANNVWQTLNMSLRTGLNFFRMVWYGISDLFRGLVSVKELAGPVGVASLIAQTGEASASPADAALNISYLAAFLAVNLAFMNLLPIPALDGGKIFTLLVTWAIQRLTGRTVSGKIENWIHAVGMILLLVFAVFITLKDIIGLVK